MSYTKRSFAVVAVVASAAGAQTTTPPTETAPRHEERIIIAGTTLRMRPTEDGFQEATLTAKPEQLFGAIGSAYADVGLNVKELDQDRRQAGTGTFRAQFRLAKQRLSQFVDCGPDPMGLPQADSYSLQMRVLTQVLPEGTDRSTVRTLVQTVGRPPSNSGLTVHCTSKGKLEEMIAEAIAKRAAQ